MWLSQRSPAQTPRRAGHRLAAAALLGLLLLSACSPSAVVTVPPPPASTGAATADAAAAPSPTALPPGFLLPGEGASLAALPPGVPFTGHLLISESSAHSRLLEIDPAGNVTWAFATTAPPLTRPLGAPDDAFYSLDGSVILLSSEDGQGAMAIRRGTGALLWQVGTYDQRGKDGVHFNNPDDLVPAADGNAWMADIRNCRVLHLAGATGAIMSIRGGTGCRHNPPLQFASPNGAFPTRDGSLVVTEIGGSWVSWLNADGSVRWSHRVPAAYPSDAMAYPDGSVLLTDYSSAGQVLRVAADGTVLWRYAPTGGDRLNHTSIAIPLASNRVAICDDFNNRIVVVDPSTSAVVWRWSGSGAFRLLRPDGLDYRSS